MEWIRNIFKEKNKRKFKVRFYAVGFMSNRYVAAEFIEVISDFDIKKGQVHSVVFSKYSNRIERHYKRKPNGDLAYSCAITEIS